MKHIVISLILLNSFNIISMQKRLNCPYSLPSHTTHYKPGIITLSAAQVEAFKKARGKDLKES